MNREAKEHLVLILGMLKNYCKPQYTKWPFFEFLRLLEDSVMLLIATQRKKRPSPAWKAFRLLDRRMPSLRLVLRLNNLVKRARVRLVEAGESAVSKLKRQASRGDKHARKLLRDIGRLREDLSNAKAIDWAQHENVLKQVSGNRGLKLSCGDSPASPKVICYTRAVEILIDDYRRKPLRDESRTLIKWVARIGHPEAKSLCAFDNLAWVVEEEEAAWRGKSALRKREKGRERQKRYREGKMWKILYPGGWIRATDLNDRFLPAGLRRAKPVCELCHGHRASAHGDYGPGDTPYWYFHYETLALRCDDCQEAEWEAEGFEVENGCPFYYEKCAGRAGRPDYYDFVPAYYESEPKVTAVERVAARDEAYRLKTEQIERWARSSKGQQIQDVNRQF